MHDAFQQKGLTPNAVASMPCAELLALGHGGHRTIKDEDEVRASGMSVCCVQPAQLRAQARVHRKVESSVPSIMSQKITESVNL